MTFNLRFDNPKDGANRWVYRRELLVHTILDQRPDLLGTQEGMPSQLQYLNEALTGYEPAIKWRRADPDPRVQLPTIYYRSHEFGLSDGGEFWLSTTPQVHRSKSWETAFPRLFTYARFIHRDTKTPIWFGNTHLDHVSEQARIEGAKLIAEWARPKKSPIILGGDFNAQPDSQEHRILTQCIGRLKDSWLAVKPGEPERHSTIHHFTGKPSGGRIDWILVSLGIRVKRVAIHDTRQGNRFPSDHFPYTAEIEIV